MLGINLQAHVDARIGAGGKFDFLDDADLDAIELNGIARLQPFGVIEDDNVT